MSCGNSHYKDLTPVRQETVGRFVREIASYYRLATHSKPILLLLWHDGQATVMADNVVLAKCTDPDEAVWQAVQYVRRTVREHGLYALVEGVSNEIH